MGRSRKTMKGLPKKDEQAEDYFEGIKKNNNDSRTSANDSAQSKNQKESALQSQPIEATVQATAPDQPSIWNKNTVDQLFPEAQLANVEDDQLSQAIAESICTAQQESERRKMAGNPKIQIPDEPDDDEWFDLINSCYTFMCILCLKRYTYCVKFLGERKFTETFPMNRLQIWRTVAKV